MKFDETLLGKKLRQSAEARVSPHEPDFESLWARARKTRSLRFPGLMLGVASAAAVLVLALGLWPAVFPSAEELAYRESVRNLAQEILPVNPPQVGQDAEASWMTSVLDPDSDNSDF
ncbi:MAG: hypothetical protein HKM06_09300 [Spirochaetales bacterium]|nr:hypothetical protein [Spirochaetales bacterium]